MVWVTKYQKERILQNASVKGYKTMSDYIRDITLHKNQFIEDKLTEILRRIEKLEGRIGKGN